MHKELQNLIWEKCAFVFSICIDILYTSCRGAEINRISSFSKSINKVVYGKCSRMGIPMSSRLTKIAVARRNVCSHTLPRKLTFCLLERLGEETTMDAAKSVSEPLHGFVIESVRLVRRCNKPDRKGMDTSQLWVNISLCDFAENVQVENWLSSASEAFVINVARKLLVNRSLHFQYDRRKLILTPFVYSLTIYPLPAHCIDTEFIKITTATAVGFAVMGFIGFLVRLIHIPVNSILLG